MQELGFCDEYIMSTIGAHIPLNKNVKTGVESYLKRPHSTLFLKLLTLKRTEQVTVSLINVNMRFLDPFRSIYIVNFAFYHNMLFKEFAHWYSTV